MREGAWIHARTGTHAWITEHASWIQGTEHARSLGLPEEAIARIRSIPWDANGPGRKRILLAAMEAGLIRFRGHGADVTFEFTLPLEEAMAAVAPFMAAQFGPATWVRMTNLRSFETVEGPYGAWPRIRGQAGQP